MTQEIIRNASSFMIASNIQEGFKVAELISNSSFCPKDYRGKVGDILCCLELGASVGLQPMQAIQNISVINGRPSIWGDAMLAICMNHPHWGTSEEYYDESTGAAYCIVDRRGQKTVTQSFSIDDAKKANLWNKQGPWTQYPKRMLQMRARGFALRDAFPDAIKGLITREEAMDLPPVEKEARQALKETPIQEYEAVELLELAAECDVTPDDICKMAKKSSIEELEQKHYQDFKPRLIKKIQEKKKELELKSMAEDGGLPDVEVKKFLEEIEQV